MYHAKQVTSVDQKKKLLLSWKLTILEWRKCYTEKKKAKLSTLIFFFFVNVYYNSFIIKSNMLSCYQKKKKVIC